MIQTIRSTLHNFLLAGVRLLHNAGLPVARLGFERDLIRSEFDPEFYARKYPEVVDKTADLFQHFLHVGWRQGKDPNAWFSTRNYLAYNSDVRSAKINPFGHYILRGRREGRPGNPVAPKERSEAKDELKRIYPVVKAEFDTEYYFSSAPHIRAAGADPVHHYISVGWREGKNPNPRFITDYYLDANPDVRKAKINPFYHYLKHGRSEGRPPSPFGSGPRAILLSDLLHGKACETPPDPGRATIVVPVYNNVEDVAALVANLQETVSKTVKVVLVDDCSPDQRILPLLTAAADGRPNWAVIKNETNLGFAGAVNRGIAAAEGHVIVLNSDLECPSGWVERLLAPIVLHPDDIGSVTPFSNHSSLTGFPQLVSEMPLDAIGSLESVDNAFRSMQPTSVDIPSGVGFCLAMNSKAIDQIGVLDEVYKRGYYEDTDWCQRLATAGFRNVACANLFVHHKVGSKSFSVPARRALSNANRKIFEGRYPYFKLARRRFHEADPLLEIRTLAQAVIWRRQAASAHLMIDHSWGGGANDFSARQRDALLAENAFVVQLVLREDKADIKIYYGNKRLEIRQSFKQQLWHLADHFDVDQIVLNGLHSAHNMGSALSHVAELSLWRPLAVYVHDFLSVCPSIFLLKDNDRHCGVPDRNTCNACFFHNRNIRYPAFSIDEWRREWRPLLERAKNIYFFSESSKEIFSRAYPDIVGPNAKIVDPGYAVSLPVAKAPRTDRRLNIGVLGAMRPHKGSRVIISLAAHLAKVGEPAGITVIGPWEDIKPPKNVKIVGSYEVSQLTSMVEKENVEAIVFPSVCPETYSCTLSEIFAMKLPVVSLRVGAQGDRVANYEYGVTIDNPDPALIFAALKEASRKRWGGAGETPKDGA